MYCCFRWRALLYSVTFLRMGPSWPRGAPLAPLTSMTTTTLALCTLSKPTARPAWAFLNIPSSLRPWPPVTGLVRSRYGTDSGVRRRPYLTPPEKDRISTPEGCSWRGFLFGKRKNRGDTNNLSQPSWVLKLTFKNEANMQLLFAFLSGKTMDSFNCDIKLNGLLFVIWKKQIPARLYRLGQIQTCQPSKSAGKQYWTENSFTHFVSNNLHVLIRIWQNKRLEVSKSTVSWCFCEAFLYAVSLIFY